MLFRFNRKAVSTEGETGPFRDCIQMTTDLFDHGIIPSLTDAIKESPQWSIPFAILQGDAGLRSSRDDRDIFELLDSVELSVDKACSQIYDSHKVVSTDVDAYELTIRQRDDMAAKIAQKNSESNKMRKAANATRSIIKEKIRTFKRQLLGHPINIVLAAFLMDTSNQAKVSKVGIFDYGFRNGKSRSAKSFINSFAFDYLAAVYMISYDCLVRMRSERPSIEYFKREASSMEVFTRRAQSDIEHVGIVVLSFCCTSLQNAFDITMADVLDSFRYGNVD